MSKKGFVIPLIIAIVAILVIGGVYIYDKGVFGICYDCGGKWYPPEAIISNSTTTPSITIISPNGGENWIRGKANPVNWIYTGTDEKDTITIGFQPIEDISKVCWAEDTVLIKAKQGSYTINPDNVYCNGGLSKLKSYDKYKMQVQVSKYSGGLGAFDMSDNYFTITPASTTSDSVICTQDAMQCPDGSWVGRTGPKCEFVCPIINQKGVRLDQSVIINGISITPIEVISDSRCPEGVVCVWAGTVKLKVNLTANNVNTQTILTLDEPFDFTLAKARALITLTTVRPDRVYQVPILPGDYLFEFSVDRSVAL